MAAKRILLHEPVNIPEGFASEAEEAAFWDRVELADDFPRLDMPPELDVPPDLSRVELPAAELRSWRRRLGLTQHDLDATLGLPRGTIACWERGRAPVSPMPMVRLALERIEQLQQRGRRGPH